MSINQKRTSRMKLLSVQELKKFAEAGSLSSAAAIAELRRRGEVYVPSLWWLGGRQ
jgi:hypothetical protein